MLQKMRKSYHKKNELSKGDFAKINTKDKVRLTDGKCVLLSNAVRNREEIPKQNSTGSAVRTEEDEVFYLGVSPVNLASEREIATVILLRAPALPEGCEMKSSAEKSRVWKRKLFLYNVSFVF